MEFLRLGRAGLIGALVLSLGALAAPAFAQTGQLKGKVVDAQNTPLRGAVIIIIAKATNRRLETKTDAMGQWRQIGLPPGEYAITAQKDKLAQSFDVKLGVETKEVNFSLEPGGGKPSAEAAKKEEARIAGIKAAFAEGAELTNAGKFDEALAKFNEVLKDVPKCAECYTNIGAIHTRQKDWPQAEEAYKKAIEANPDLVDPYNGLANVYNAQKKFNEAQAMSAEATKRAAAGGAGAGNADALYNAGVIAWNANDFPKAQELFASAVKANDKHAEAHFMLGQAYLNTGKLPEAAKEFETYAQIAPNGPNAEKAKANFEMLKQYIK
ncbi:MAG: tetratricopeptide repeat protein [Vicinamibacterales bacterium]